MKKFISHHADQVLGFLSGFDRIRFRGTFRQLAHTSGMLSILYYLHVLLKDFHNFAEQTTARFRAGIEGMAERADRPVQYLSSPQTNKEELVQKRLRDQGVGRHGVIAVFSTVEVCKSYEIRRDRERKEINLQPALRKCLHYYVYLHDPMFGLVHVRMQSWFPLNTHIVINGREWLARQMDAADLKYQRADNCFPWIEDFACAQHLAKQQLNINWPKQLDRLLYRANPALRGILPTVQMEPYWSADQSEWARHDAPLLAAVTRGEFLIKGFRNADIRIALLGSDPEDPAERRRRSARISRLIALLRAHGLVKKIPKTQRYLITAFAQQCLPAILAAREATLKKLTAA